MTLRIDADWLRDPALQSLLAALGGNGEEARVVGGAIRNHYLGHPITDIDIATTTPPQETIRRGEAAGFKAVPTGIDHGTVTLVLDGRPFEVTTLRQDRETDGRHAVVEFGRDWKRDAQRRDFTINALYADASGSVLDLVGGMADIDTGRLRFIGAAEDRIHEDYLRTLRFYRFFAWYGSGRPDGDAIRATARLKDGLAALSAERVWAELKKLLAAADPSRALLWMRQAGVLTAVLPESERWGIDAIHPLVEAEHAFVWPADPILRLMAIVPPDAGRLTAMAGRLRMSNAEKRRLVAFAMTPPVSDTMADRDFVKLMYASEKDALTDRLKLDIALARARGADHLPAVATLTRRMKQLLDFEPLAFPLGGNDLAQAGVAPGPQMGLVLAALRQRWVDSDFVLDRQALLDLVPGLQSETMSS